MKQINLAPIHKDSLNSVGYGAFPNSSTTCFDCGTSTTSLWRRDSMGNSVCNACRLYFLHHNKKRPTSSVPHVIRRRNRKKSIKTSELQSPTKLAPMTSWSWNRSQCLPSIDNVLSHQPSSISPEMKDRFNESSNQFYSRTPLIECRPVDSLQFEYSKQYNLSSPTSDTAHYSNSLESHSTINVDSFGFDSGISYSCLQASLALLDLANFPVHSITSSPSTMAPPPSPR